MVPKNRVQCGLRPHCTLFFGVPFTELRKSQIYLTVGQQRRPALKLGMYFNMASLGG
jgi:hypothetical protein